MSGVVLIVPSGAVAEAAQRIEAAAPGIEIAAITWAEPAEPSVGVEPTIILGRPIGRTTQRLVDRAQTSPLGRNAIRLTPLDPGRRLARALKRDRRSRELMVDADIIVAAERDAILSAWTAGRRWASPRTAVVYGVAPAAALLAERSGETGE